jgi:hypothetical protein
MAATTTTVGGCAANQACTARTTGFQGSTCAARAISR